MTIPNTMRAAVALESGAPLIVQEVAVPVPANGQVLVRLESCGICHSDLHLRNGDENLPTALYPRIFGHEGIGRIAAIAEGTRTNFGIGDRVGLPWLYDTCLECRPCLTGHETNCQANHARGVHCDGAFAEYALADVRFISAIPEGIDPVEGAPLLCAGLTAWSAIGKTGLHPAKRCLVIGCGGLGQYAIHIAKAHGATVFAVDTDPAKLAQAQSCGANLVFQGGPETGERIKAAGGADAILNFAPTPSVWPMIEAAANPMSDIVAVALVHDPVPLSTMWLIDGGHKVYGSSVGTRQELSDFLDFAARMNIKLPVETVPLSGIDAALDRLQSGDVLGRLCVDFSL